MRSLLDPDVLRVLSVALLASAWLFLVVAMFEERVTRGPEYDRRGLELPIRLFLWMCRLGFFGMLYYTVSYTRRAALGWPDMHGWQLSITFVNYIVVWVGVFVPAFVLLNLVAMATKPTDAEKRRRDATRRRRLELERGTRSDNRS